MAIFSTVILHDWMLEKDRWPAHERTVFLFVYCKMDAHKPLVMAGVDYCSTRNFNSARQRF